MKKTRFVELLKTIKSTRVSFISIVFFIFLGTGLFLGFGWAAKGFEVNADKTYNNNMLQDAIVQGAYGLTDELIEDLKKIEGVDAIEGIYETEQFVNINGGVYQVRVLSFSNEVNKPIKLIGNPPQKIGEIVVDSLFANAHNLQIGDTISFRKSNDDTTYMLKALLDEDLDTLQENKLPKSGIKNLLTDTYTITGIVYPSEYPARYKMTLGTASNSIQIDSAMYVSKDAFDLDSFIGYSKIAIYNSSIHEYTSITKDYNSQDDEFIKKLKVVTDKYTDDRFNAITIAKDNIESKILEEIDNGEEDLADGEKEILDNENKIIDAEKEINDGQKELADGKKKLIDGQIDIDDGYIELDEAEKIVKNNEILLKAIRKAFYETLDTFSSIDYYVSNWDTGDSFKEKRINYEALYTECITYPDFLSFFSDNDISALEKLHDASYDDPLPIPIPDVSTYFPIASFIVKYSKFADFISLDNEAELLMAHLTEYKNTLSDLSQISKMGELISSVNFFIEKSDKVKDLPDKASNCYTFIKNRSDQFEFTEIILEEFEEKISAEGGNFDEIVEASKKLQEAIEEDMPNSVITERAISLVRIVSPFAGNLKEILESNEYRIDEAFDKLKDAIKRIKDAYKKLEQAQVEVDNGWVEYNDNLNLLNRSIEKLNDGKKELEDGKKKLEDGRNELKEGKEKYNDFLKATEKLEKYDTNVQGRQYIAGVSSTRTSIEIITKLRYTMATLFVIIGTFVCYSAISRLVYEQTILIGTKKALGLSVKEITSTYVLYTFIASTIGIFLGFVLATFIIEPIIILIMSDSFSIDTFDLYFDLKELTIFGAFEYIATIFATVFACAKTLKKKAIILLQGQETVLGKERIYEKTKLWKKLSLVTRTIINNIFNDSKRAIGTIIGIAGCCSLLVAASVLYTNMTNSFNKQSSNLTTHDTVIYLDRNVDDAMDKITNILDDNNLNYAKTFLMSGVFKTPANTYCIGIFTSFEDDNFYNYYVLTKDGKNRKLDDEVVISESFYKWFNLSNNDEITFIDSQGKKYDIEENGYFEMYLPRTNVIMDRKAYERTLNTKYESNSLILNRGEFTIEELTKLLIDVDGFVCINDYVSDCNDSNRALTGSLYGIIALYFALSFVLAFLVILNLLVMFVDEKKKELIVMMINGFSKKTAKKYIYLDTIILTAIGIIVGSAIGSYVGLLITQSLDSDSIYYLKELDPKIYIVGAGITSLLTYINCKIALRKVDNFKLTEINSK